jgi:hypothetical protein
MLQLAGKKQVQTVVLLLFVCVTAYASVMGPDPGYTDAPGDQGNCTACHDHNLVNTGPGSVRVNGLPSVYEPGQTYSFTVTTAQSGRIRFGFQLTALGSNFKRAGTLASADGSTQVLPQTGAGGRQYIEHREEGTLATSSGSRTWPLRWTAPDTDVGTVRFFVAGNATDNSGVQDDNDFIYTSSFGVDSPTTFVTVNLQTELAGLVLAAGTSQMLNWSVTGGSNIDNVELRYSTDDGATFPISNKFFFTTDPSVTSVNWTVPNTPTTHAVVRILVGKKSGDAVQVLSPSFTITGDGTVPLPVITSASATGKKLVVNGQNFAIGAVVLVKGNEAATLNDEADPSHLLRCKKGAKKIAPGTSAILTVRNPDGTLSDTFLFNRPEE